MAFGLSPKHVQDISLDNLTAQQFLVLTLEAAKKLDWSVGHVSETGFVAFTKFSMSSWSEEVKVKIEGSSAQLKSECTGSQVVDWGKNKANIEKLVETFNELKDSFNPEELANKYEELKSNLISAESEGLDETPLTTKGKLTNFFSIFKPTKGYFITPVLIDLNIIIFILMIVSGVNILLPDSESLIKWGANFRPVTLNGEWWRLLTSCFLHIGVIHLLLNMYALLYIGLLLEPYLGKARFSTAYLLTGIISSVTSLWWHEYTVSAGASGAIFGMYGVFLAMLTTNLIEKSARKALLTSIAVFVGYNLLNGLKGGIDNAAHIGGLVSGLIIGYTFIPALKKPEDRKLEYRPIILLIAASLILSFLVYKKIPNDIAIYENKIKEFTSLETSALEVYNLPQNTPDEKILVGIKDKGIHNWNESIKLIDSFKAMDLPAEITRRNQLLREYCELRIKSYELLYKAISENTEKYKDEIEVYNKQIEAKINQIGGDQSSK